jgi:hypothetical protein
MNRDIDILIDCINHLELKEHKSGIKNERLKRF